MNTNRYLWLLTAALIILSLAAACANGTPTVSLGIDDSYRIARMQKLHLASALTGQKYQWSINGEIVASDREFIFLAEEEGIYSLCFEIIDSRTPFRHEFTVEVVHEEVEYSPYIAKVWDYHPAPGQFINEMPLYEAGDTEADMVQKVEECIKGTNDVMISLGGFGGYVTFSFDHTVINHPGQNDIRIWGNCFYELTDPEHPGGSAEPGIVMVSYDTNCNGLPDDQWYELAGSEYANASTIHNYGITYHRPEASKAPIPDKSGFISDTEYIRWDDTAGRNGFIARNIFHSQAYYPLWIDSDVITFSGSLLPPNAIDTQDDGSYWILYSYPWGYVDNHPNDYPELNSFDISHAVDSCGKSVDLPGVDFVRVYTGVNQYCGWLGETSTELCRAADLHIAVDTALPAAN